ncbi:MAG: phage tail protein [Cyanobacteria bacterium CAN_BIN43]|nr:phage tail protein [Cyanobacteria bacterium CAN_BIN43]
MESASKTANNEFNYVTSNRFYVEIESTITACFSECSGLGMQIKKETFMEGGVNDQQRIILGQTEFTDVTLKRGITSDLLFWTWISKILTPRNSGTATSNHRRNVNILTFNQAGETMQCWTLIGAVPLAWKAPSLTASASSVAIEELTLAYEGLKIVASSGGGGATMLTGRGASGYFSSN